MKLKSTALIPLITIASLTLLFFWKILLTNLILVGVDTFLYFYPYKAYVSEVLCQGRLPLWNPYLFMGAPLLANSQVGLFYPLNWPLVWLDPPRQVAWSIGLHIALAGILMLTYTRQALRLSWPGALTAAVVFAFGGYLGAQVEHINQLNAAAWLPLLFLLYDFGIERHRQRRWFWFWLLALVIAITLLAGHAQTVFISLFGLGLYALYLGIRNQELEVREGGPGGREQSSRNGMVVYVLRNTPYVLHRFILPLAVVSMLAAALAAIQLISTAELSALSIRSGGLPFREVISFSLQPATLHYSLLPPLGVDLSQVWDEAFSERVGYIGISGLLLAGLGGFCSIWQREIRRFVFLAGCGLMLSLGLYGGIYLVLYYLPGFNMFRAPARWLLLYAFGASILAGYGLDALLTPATLLGRLTSIWHWLCARRWRLALAGLPVVGLFVLIGRKTPPFFTLATWFSLTIITIGLIYYAISKKHATYVLRITHHVSPAILILPLLVIELFWAAQTLNYNQPTAPQAYHSMRNAVAFLLAASPTDSPDLQPSSLTPALRASASVLHPSLPPDRFLSLSGITYDPGDLADLEQIYGDHLSAKAVYNLIVATKEKEVLFFNLPLVYGLNSVDGYDGGILPLKQFVTLQKLFLLPEDLSIDGRLREKLRLVPPGRLLSLLNTRWIITDKVFDAWIDNIFYDLQFPAILAPGQTISTTDIPTFPATAIGLVSHLENAASLPANTPVAKIAITFGAGQTDTLTLKAGVDTAEGNYPANAAHPQAKIGVAWPYAAAGVDYITVDTLTRRGPITGIAVTATLPQGQFVLRGVSLIHQATHTSRSVILSTEGDYRQVYSGDVKIYENQAVLPRAFIVHQAELVKNDDQAIALLRDPGFDPRQKSVRVIGPGESAGLVAAGQPSPEDAASIVSYQPERVEIKTSLVSPGWLVLTDTNYPGWQVRVDGQPTQILPVNIMFRAVALPTGEHTIVFEFQPRSVQLGMIISAIAVVVLVEIGRAHV